MAIVLHSMYMNIPLMCDILAEKISYLFSEVRPHILESEDKDCDNCISWIDVIREGPLQAEQHNEKYRFRLRDRLEVFEMTQFDYDLIVSGLPRKLLCSPRNPYQRYSCGNQRNRFTNV